MLSSSTTWRGLLAACISVAACAFGASPAAADNQQVQVRDNNFNLPGVAVKPGESVTWAFPLGNGTDSHNVHFEDNLFEFPPEPTFAPWMSPPRTFAAAGTYQYYCENHGGPGQQGMFGRVYVNAAGTVPAGPPTASFTTTPGTAGVSQNVILNASGSTDPNGTIVRHEWDLDNDGFYERDTAGNPVTTHSYLTPGEHHIRLRVTDNDALISEIEDHVHVTARPTAAFTASANPATAGQPVAFDASGSTDPDGSILNYRWDLDGDGTFETNRGPNPTVERVYTTPGAVAVALRVTDNLGIESGMAIQTLQVVEPVVVAPPPPPPAITPPPAVPPPPPAAQISRLGSSVAITAKARRTYTLLTKLSVRRARFGSTIRVRCTGKRCPFKTKTKKVTKNATRLDVTSLVRGRKLRPGNKLEIRVTKSGTIGVVRTLTIRAGRSPRSQNLCIRPGATKPGSCSA
jgi:plastocyanin